MTPAKRGALQERYRLAQLLAHPMALLRIGKLTSMVIANYRDERLQTVRGSTVRRELALLRHVVAVAQKEWGIPIEVNPVALIKQPSLPAARKRRLQGDEFERLINGCKRGRSPLLEPTIRLAIETGLRRGELVNIQWAELDLDARTLHVPVTKNGHARTIPLTGIAIRIFESLPRSDNRALPSTANAIRLAWVRLKRRVGIDDLRFHDLRHEAISRFFELGLY